MDRRTFLKGGALLPIAALPAASEVEAEEYSYEQHGPMVEQCVDGKWRRRIMDPHTGKRWAVMRGREIAK